MLGRTDLAGKTGTTNIGGTNESEGRVVQRLPPNLVATVWMSVDQEEVPRHVRAERANTALPIWIHLHARSVTSVS